MEFVKFIRRGVINSRKRFNLFKYNINYKMERGQFYDLEHDIKSLNTQIRSINLFDFSKQEDLYLLDEYSDAT